MLPLFIYRKLKFEKPASFSEMEYLDIKKFGIDEHSTLIPYKDYHKLTFVFIVVGTFILISKTYLRSYYHDVLTYMGGIILFYAIPKFIIESFKYRKYKKEELNFKNKAVDLARHSSNYSEFLKMYKDEIMTSTFGRYLINKFNSKK